jgi:hypothetical protein
MSNKPDLKQILIDHPESWDHDGMRPDARFAFQKATECGTGALGTIRFVSPSGEELNLPCTCKSSACTSCGHRAMLDWLATIGSSLPNVLYYGGFLSMHEDLWEIFRDNRHLLLGLPAIAANALQDWADKMYGARVAIIVVLHTFQGRLDSKPHVHFVVSSVGLDGTGNDLVWDIRWDFYYVEQAIMKKWRHAVVDYLLTALDLGLISSARPKDELKVFIEKHWDRWWKAGIRKCTSVNSLVRYMARYLRRPPIAERRLLSYDGQKVSFWYKDTETEQILQECYSADEFIRRWAEHIPDRYCHGVHYFGLLAPWCKGSLYEVFLALLKQERRPRPRRTPWRKLIRLIYRRDPLRTLRGEVMQRIGWRPPKRPNASTVQILRQ